VISDFLPPLPDAPHLHGLFGAHRAQSDDELFGAFEKFATSRGLSLYPAQEEAAVELVTGKHVILSTPTGSGKSMVAIAAHVFAYARGERSYYTAPIKALVSEKFFDLVAVFGAENVGMVTGDSSVNADAPIICCTAEILANIALREGKLAEVGTVIMDEFHFYGDPQRGWAWQVPLVELPQAQFLLMSATLGDVTRFKTELPAATGRELALISHTDRPIPLHFFYSEEPLQDQLEELVSTKQTPVYVVHFSQLEAIERAQGLASLKLLTPQEKAAMAEAIGDFRFSAGFGRVLSRLVRSGIGVHHAGMLPKYRRLVEQLAQRGLLKVICGTDTLGVGINVPIRTVLFTALSKFDGTKSRILQAREFHQIAGRAGRAGFDTAGTVVVQAPEHTIENKKAMEKARAKFGDDERKLRQVTKKKPPQGFISWGEPTFDRLVNAEPEALTPTMNLSHSMVINILARCADPIDAARHLIENAHVPVQRQFALKRQGLGILRELTAGGLVKSHPQRDSCGRRIALTAEVPENFALNQPLAPFALAALTTLDDESAAYAMDAVSVIEAILDDPRQVLSAQHKKARTEAMGAMKADGLDYSERMARLDEVTYEKPLEELLEQNLEVYRSGAPWLAGLELSPKSIVRDMYLRAMNFPEFVNHYALARSEGVLLRYLSDAYRTMSHLIPPEALTDDLEDVIEWLGELVKQTDSSLLDEWEKLQHPDDPETESPLPPAPIGVTVNERAFIIMIRNALFHRVRLFADEQNQALAALDAENGGTMTADDWADALDAYFGEYEDIDDTAEARAADLLILRKTGRLWTARQILRDPEDNRDFGFDAEIDLDASDEAGSPVLRITRADFAGAVA
jgi:superfamily II RNA helicase